MTDPADTIGPVSYLVVEFPGNKMTGEGFEALIDLVNRGVVRVIDLVFVTRRDDGSVAALALHELDAEGFDLAVFEGASAGLLDQSDIDEVGDVIEPGSSAGVLLVENCWARDFVAGMRRGGGELVAAGYIPLGDLAAALDGGEPA